MEKKNKNRIIGLSLGILAILLVVLTSTYAYWQISRSQIEANTIVSSCLKIEMEDASSSIALEEELPITDFEGMQLEGYKFIIKNECEKPQDYRIDLDRLVEESGQNAMSNEYLATLLDYGVPVMYSELEQEDTVEDGVKEKRILAYDTVMGKSENEHILRLWINENSPVSEQNTTFLSKIKITASKDIKKEYTASNCFAFDSSIGSITGYDVACGGTDVIIPYQIDEVAVTQIGNQAFKQKGITSVELPRSVTAIGNQAFFNNLNLEKVVFKDGLTTIAAGAFAGSPLAYEYSKISFIKFPETLTTIGPTSFRSTSIKQVIIPDSVTSIGVSAFLYGKLENLILGEGLTEISNHVFKHNDIRKVVFRDNILKIGQSSFADNPIEELTFGFGITSIGYAAFGNEDALSKYYNQNFLKAVYIPKNITNIGKYAFENATSDVIITVENPESAMTLGDGWSGKATVIFGE